MNIKQKNLNNSFFNKLNYSLYILFGFDISFSFIASNGFHVYCLLFFNIIHISYEILIMIYENNFFSDTLILWLLILYLFYGILHIFAVIGLK